MKNYSICFLPFLIALGISLGSCSEGARETTDNAGTSTNVEDSNAKVESDSDDDTSSIDKPDLESSILDIREQFQDTEKNLKSYTKKTAEMEADGEPYADLIGYYDKDGQPRKLVKEEAMGHSASTVSYYRKDKNIYFIFEQSTSEASVMGPFTFKERRIYLKDGNIIRLLEKEKTVDMDENPELSIVPNKDVTASLKNNSGRVYFDDLDEMLKLLANTKKPTEKTKVQELSFENTRWKSTDDPKSVIEVNNGKWKNIYDGKDVGSGDYKLGGKSNSSQLTVTENGEIYEYYIIKHTEKELQMSMIGGRGNTLSYIKD